jgi:hypothetical protein
VLDVTWRVSPEQDLYHASKVLTGLSALRRKGRVRLKFVPDRDPPAPGGLIIVLQVQVGEQAARNVIIDLSDTSDFISPSALDHADVYFKRSLTPGPLLSLPAPVRTRVRPFGLNFACVDAGSWSDWLAASVARARAGHARGVRTAARSFANDLQRFIGIPSHEAFVGNVRAPKRAIALFQTRVWPPGDSHDNLELLNLQRVSLVKQLRATLGSQFVGGIVDSPFARTTFPGLVVSDSTHRRAYAALTRSALIGVYSRGIHGSPAFKLTEYLAAGCCMVAEPIEHTLDIPLVSGVHYLPFDSGDACARCCKLLLDDQGLSAEMSRRNAEYFRQYLLPERHIARVLEEVASVSRAGGLDEMRAWAG